MYSYFRICQCFCSFVTWPYPLGIPWFAPDNNHQFGISLCKLWEGIHISRWFPNVFIDFYFNSQHHVVFECPKGVSIFSFVFNSHIRTRLKYSYVQFGQMCVCLKSVSLVSVTSIFIFVSIIKGISIFNWCPRNVPVLSITVLAPYLPVIQGS